MVLKPIITWLSELTQEVVYTNFDLVFIRTCLLPTQTAVPS